MLVVKPVGGNTTKTSKIANGSFCTPSDQKHCKRRIPPPPTPPSPPLPTKKDRKKRKKRKRKKEEKTNKTKQKDKTRLSLTVYCSLTLVRCQTITVLFYVCSYRMRTDGVNTSYRGEKEKKVRCFTEYSVITMVNVSRCIVYLNVGERFHRIQSLNLDDPFSLCILYFDVGEMLHRI